MNLNEKSRGTSFILTLLFGPLGLLYASVAAGLILCVIAFLTFYTIVVPVICWVLSIAIGDHLVHRHNQGVERLRQALSQRNNQET